MKIIKYFLQFLFIVIFFSLFKILGLNISSALGGKLFEKIGNINFIRSELKILEEAKLISTILKINENS